MVHMLNAPYVPLLPFPCKAGQFSDVDPQILRYLSSTAAASSPGLAMQSREPTMQAHIFLLTTGGKVGEAEKAAPVEQLGVKVFDTT